MSEELIFVISETRDGKPSPPARDEGYDEESLVDELQDRKKDEGCTISPETYVHAFSRGLDRTHVGKISASDVVMRGKIDRDQLGSGQSTE